ncbi:MAG TPA: preprotein translocase subunit YajC [Mycobacteriales bacterium]|nr:preprotein translocase subunit YajC [Mycobacteriales bacterium]
MGDTAGALLPLLLLVLVGYFLILRPVRARNQALQQTRRMQDALTPGVEVMTTSGLFGRIIALAADSVDLEIAPGVVVRWARAAIAEVRSPAAEPPAEPLDVDPADVEPADVEPAPRRNGEPGTP